MANEFDPYREALVVELRTLWPDEYDDFDSDYKRRVEDCLHAEPAQAAQLDYVRLHSGFCRQITVTPQDLERLQ
jgi:hypothetical protein